MEEKERFELFGEHCIKDNNPDARPQLFDACVACVILNEQYKHIKDLEAKLAEKEGEIEDLKAQRRIYLNRSVEECNKITDLEFELQHKHQDKISFAVEQLEKVKENIKKVPIIDFDLSGNFEKMYKQDAIRQIDNQIKELKGEE